MAELKRREEEKEERTRARPETREMIRFCHVSIVSAIDMTPLPVRACACRSRVSLYSNANRKTQNCNLPSRHSNRNWTSREFIVPRSYWLPRSPPSRASLAPGIFECYSFCYEQGLEGWKWHRDIAVFHPRRDREKVIFLDIKGTSFIAKYFPTNNGTWVRPCLAESNRWFRLITFD